MKYVNLLSVAVLLQLSPLLLLLRAGSSAAAPHLDSRHSGGSAREFKLDGARELSKRGQQQGQSAGGGKMWALDGRSSRPLALMPGLLDETLLNRGAFSFGAKQVAFNKLKVLGNVYVNHVNGRPLRETYLLRSMADGAGGGHYPNAGRPHGSLGVRPKEKRQEAGQPVAAGKEGKSQSAGASSSSSRRTGAKPAGREFGELRLQLVQ